MANIEVIFIVNEVNKMLGKITDSQTEFLLNRINNLADGGEYTLVHLGCGIPELPDLRLDKWAHTPIQVNCSTRYKFRSF